MIKIAPPSANSYKMETDKHASTDGYAELRLSYSDVLDIHRTVVSSFGKTDFEVTDEDLLHQLVEAPYITAKIEDSDVFDKAGSYFMNMINNSSVFSSSGVITSMAVTAVLLDINGFAFDKDFKSEDLIMLVFDVSKGYIRDVDTVSDILRSNTHVTSLEEMDMLSKLEKEEIRRWFVDSYTGRYDSL